MWILLRTRILNREVGIANCGRRATTRNARIARQTRASANFFPRGDRFAYSTHVFLAGVRTLVRRVYVRPLCSRARTGAARTVNAVAKATGNFAGTRFSQIIKYNYCTQPRSFINGYPPRVCPRVYRDRDNLPHPGCARRLRGRKKFPRHLLQSARRGFSCEASSRSPYSLNETIAQGT